MCAHASVRPPCVFVFIPHACVCVRIRGRGEGERGREEGKRVWGRIVITLPKLHNGLYTTTCMTL
jgi:hypothetical protein